MRARHRYSLQEILTNRRIRNVVPGAKAARVCRPFVIGGASCPAATMQLLCQADRRLSIPPQSANTSSTSSPRPTLAQRHAPPPWWPPPPTPPAREPLLQTLMFDGPPHLRPCKRSSYSGSVNAQAVRRHRINPPASPRQRCGRASRLLMGAAAATIYIAPACTFSRAHDTRDKCGS